MQFLIIGKDGIDKKAKERRSTARDAHIALGEKLKLSGNFWYGAALLDDNNEMIGSMLLMDFSSGKEMQEWLDKEPYITEEVWKSVEVLKCNVKKPWKFNRQKEFYIEKQNQFLVIGRDGTDSKAGDRRMAVRTAHLELGDEMEKSGNRWYGAVLLDDDDDDDKMIGSMAVMDFPSERELQVWLDKEPYITGKVWESVEIIKCNVRDPWQFNRPKEFFLERQK